jgi:alkylhydroperoxidase/carboxymuconolactone decarboxylase family protein YurZ
MKNFETVRQKGREIRNQLGLDDDTGLESAPGYEAMADTLVFAEIWGREGLGLRDRMIATLCVLSARERHQALEAYVGAAVRIGMSALTINEVFIHAGLYAGFVTAESAMKIAMPVYAREGVLDSLSAEGMDAPAPEDWDRVGRELMATLHGERAQSGYANPGHSTTSALYSLAIEYAYGGLWHRPGLTRRERFICSVATFATIDHLGQLKKFSQSGIDNDLTPEEVVEIIMQTAPYSGFPRALNALVAVEDVVNAS